MIIAYGESKIRQDRKAEAEKIFRALPYRYCFITGSFLSKEKYKDIDLFIITRSKKEPKIGLPKVKIQTLDFNNLYSLFYHSASKCCIAKNILPEKPLKVTVSDFWDVVNEAVPAIMNDKKNFRKAIRSLVLYIEYFKSKEILDSIELRDRCEQFKNYKEVLDYIEKEIPKAINKEASKGYIKRFFYSQAGFYKGYMQYAGQRFLYSVAHSIINGQS
jgi:hypothetical protein